MTLIYSLLIVQIACAVLFVASVHWKKHRWVCPVACVLCMAIGFAGIVVTA